MSGHKKCGGKETDPVYTKGNLVSLHLRDFMTYKNIELTAGPNLNLVLGPNGTGKSALVCGIIIGLGGEPSNTGRAGHLGEYIRFGCNSASIEVQLFNDEPTAKNFCIQRVIHSKTNSNGKVEYTSSFKLNGKDANRTKVRDFVHSLNINVDNLCQFLPQERVVEFVKMDRKTLLECTEKAAGDEKMYDYHQEMVGLSKDLKKLTEGTQSLSNQIAVETELQTRAEEELRRIEERDRYKEQIQWLRKKKPWIEYEDKRMDYEEVKKEYEEKKKEVKKVNENLEPLNKEVNNSRTLVNKCKTNKENASLELKKAAKIAEPIKAKIETTFDKIKDVKTGYFEKMEIENRRRGQLREMENTLHSLRERHDNVDEDGHDIEPQIEVVIKEMKAINTQISGQSETKNKVLEELENLVIRKNALEYKKQNLENNFRRRLNKLNELSPHAYRAYEWLQDNKNRFKNTIYPPVMTLIEIEENQWAKYVESAIKRADLSAFICEDKNDLRVFTQGLKDELNIRVNVVLAPEQNADYFEPNFDINEFAAFGLYKTVKDMFKAPDKVMAYLCKSSYLHQIPVGNHKTDQMFDKLKDRSNFRRVYGVDSLYAINVSRYDHKKMTVRDSCPESRYLNISANKVELENIKKQLEELNQKHNQIKSRLSEIEQTLVQINGQLQELKDKKKMLDDKKNEKRILETKINELQNKISRTKSIAVDTDKLKHECEQTLKKLEQKLLELMKEMKKTIAECVPLNDNKAKTILAEMYAKERLVSSQRKLSLASEQFQELKDSLKRCEEAVQTMKREAKDLRNKAKEISGFDANDCSEEIRNKFDSLPNTIDDIDNEIGTLRLRMNSIADADDNLRDQYNSRQRTIEKQQKDLESRRKEVAIKVAKLEELKNNWIPALEELISKINENFSSFMARIDCAGDVSLYKPEDLDAFDEYGISIKVKFRQSEPLRELTSFHQSGGERSVSTMIYMIALQELTTVPFRCVDEINQGMDENNERSVFELISETSSQNNSQYFLFSPKLLRGLEYNEKMRFHIIFNGPYMELDWGRVLTAINDSDDETEDED